MELPEVLAIADVQLYAAWIDIEATCSDRFRIVKVGDRGEHFAMRAKVELDPAPRHAVGQEAPSRSEGFLRITTQSSRLGVWPELRKLVIGVIRTGGWRRSPQRYEWERGLCTTFFLFLLFFFWLLALSSARRRCQGSDFVEGTFFLIFGALFFGRFSMMRLCLVFFETKPSMAWQDWQMVDKIVQSYIYQERGEGFESMAGAEHNGAVRR